MALGEFVQKNRRVKRAGKSAAVLLLAVALCFFHPLEGGCGAPLPPSGTEGVRAGGSTPTLPAVQAQLLAPLLAGEAAIDLSGLSLPVEALGPLLTALLLDEPALFFVAPRYSYSYTVHPDPTVGTERRYAATLYPVYTLTGDALAGARAAYEAVIAGTLAEMEAIFGDRPRSEAETVLYLHDALAARASYDTRPDGESVADAYRLLVEGVGICQAYALAFTALCRAAEVDCHVVTSPAMDHAWNHVRVGDAWYHVDVTRDDPIPPPGQAEEVHHDRLLRSDAGMATLGYHGFTCTELVTLIERLEGRPVTGASDDATGGESGAHFCTDTRFERGAASRLTDFHASLLPLDRGGLAPLVWVGLPIAGETAAGGGAADDTAAAPEDASPPLPVAVRLGNGGLSRFPPGDMDGDGAATPGDVLLLYGTRFPETWRENIRRQLCLSP